MFEGAKEQREIWMSNTSHETGKLFRSFSNLDTQRKGFSLKRSEATAGHKNIGKFSLTETYVTAIDIRDLYSYSYCSSKIKLLDSCFPLTLKMIVALDGYSELNCHN